MNQLKIYYNLHKHCLSVLHKTKKGWRLKEYRKSIKLKNVRFVVSEAGRQRVLREKRKNVHAYVIGIEYKHSYLPSTYYKAQRVRYNPYYMSQFMTDDFNPRLIADYCYISGKEIFV